MNDKVAATGTTGATRDASFNYAASNQATHTGEQKAVVDDFSGSDLAFEFVDYYYKILKTSPTEMHKFYHPEAYFSRLGEGVRDADKLVIHGETAINQRFLNDTNLRDVVVNIQLVDSQKTDTAGSQVLVAVIGTYTQGRVTRSFNQTVLLVHNAEHDRYYIQNDVLRFFPKNAEVVADPVAAPVAAVSPSVTSPPVVVSTPAVSTPAVAVAVTPASSTTAPAETAEKKPRERGARKKSSRGTPKTTAPQSPVVTSAPADASIAAVTPAVTEPISTAPDNSNLTTNDKKDSRRKPKNGKRAPSQTDAVPNGKTESKTEAKSAAPKPTPVNWASRVGSGTTAPAPVTAAVSTPAVANGVKPADQKDTAAPTTNHQTSTQQPTSSQKRTPRGSKTNNEQKRPARVKPEGEAVDPTTLFISNLPPNATSESIQNTFNKFGTIKSVNVTDNSKVWQISFEKEQSATDTVKAHTSTALTVLDAPVVVSRNKQTKGAGRGRGRGRGERGRGRGSGRGTGSGERGGSDRGRGRGRAPPKATSSSTTPTVTTGAG